MIIETIHLVGVAFLECEDHPPVAGNLHCPETLQRTFQLMQIRAGVSHVLCHVRGIESIQNVRELLRMSGLNSFLCAVEKKSLQVPYA